MPAPLLFVGHVPVFLEPDPCGLEALSQPFPGVGWHLSPSLKFANGPVGHARLLGQIGLRPSQYEARRAALAGSHGISFVPRFKSNNLVSNFFEVAYFYQVAMVPGTASS